MQRLDSYRLAMLAAYPEASDEQLADALRALGPTFPNFIDEHGLAALWHQRTGRDEFRDMRRQAEAIYLGQEPVLAEIDDLFEESGIPYAVIKGGANRLLLYDNPAIRACHDLDVLVGPEDRVDRQRRAERDQADHEPLRGGPHGEALRAERDDRQDQIEGGQMNTGDAHDGEIDR